MLYRLLRRQNQTENIGIELPMKLVLRHRFERFELVDAGVVNQNVELAECFLRLDKQALDVLLLRNIGLDGDCLAAALCNFNSRLDPHPLLTMRN